MSGTEQLDIDEVLSRMQISRADHLPIVAAFCRKIHLVETVNRIVPSQMDVDMGTVVQGMVLDTLSGRSPLYRLGSFFENQDTELLLGRELPPGAFNDSTVGRAMDALFETGAEGVFSGVALEAASHFPLDMSHVHFDTTSVNVWGEYDCCSPDSDTVNVTHGHSKDHRPDLKQFLLQTLCVGRNIPILGGCADGNASDKSLNNTLLSRISSVMARHGLGEGDFLYVADSAMVTEDNLDKIGSNRFVTRQPFNYNETDRVVADAVAAGDWEWIGPMNETPASAKRPAALYRLAEGSVTLHGRIYRAIVVHSSAHDKRRLKRLDRQIEESVKSLEKIIGEQTKREFFCRADAKSVAARLRENHTQLHGIEARVVERPRRRPGRPSKRASRKIVSMRYAIEATLVENTGNIQRRRDESGCFVLLTNVSLDGESALTGAELLRAYKDQCGVERNYAFLKDPLVVNDLFLKKPERIEALGAILLISLLVWNLMENTLRKHLAEQGTSIPGWDNKPTTRPTTFMMSTKFVGLQIVRMGEGRRLARPLTSVQQRYLSALGLEERDLLSPLSQPQKS
jgi:transposase